jgi:DNA-binding response OmpR family regulator
MHTPWGTDLRAQRRLAMPAKLDGKNILIVDDDQDVLASLRLAFETSGARVSTARDGNQAVEMVKRVDPELMVLDMMMPKRSGFLVLESIKPSRKADERPFVIVVTANEGKRAETWAKYLGVAEYMTKPFSIERILEKACELLGGEYIDPDTL